MVTASGPDSGIVRRRFNRRAATFGNADFVHRRTADGLMRRLAPLRLAPETIIDVGCGPGTLSAHLETSFRRSRVYCLDLSQGMLRSARKSQRWLRRRQLVCADARRMPLAARSADLVISNLLLPWVGQPDETLCEMHRVLRIGAPVAFSSLGPDSFLELRRAWQALGVGENIPAFVDMHELGDAAIRAGFGDPVLDVERLTVTYNDFARLWADLRASGSGNPLPGQRPGLGNKALFRRFEQVFREQNPGPQIPLSIELVYGHAWANPITARSQNLDEVSVPIDSIPHRSSHR